MLKAGMLRVRLPMGSLIFQFTYPSSRNMTVTFYGRNEYTRNNRLIVEPVLFFSPCRTNEIEVKVMLRPLVSWPVCLGVRLPSGAHDQIFVFCLTVAGFLMWGALSDERMGL
jgi:hypothetical protein